MVVIDETDKILPERKLSNNLGVVLDALIIIVLILMGDLKYQFVNGPCHYLND